MKKVNIISLGCSKNLVDTELLMKQLEKAGYGVEVDVENSNAKIVVINTCGFIGDAKEESINTIGKGFLRNWVKVMTRNCGTSAI